MSQNVAECRTISPSTRKPLQFTSGESHDLGRFPSVFAHFRPFPPHPALACALPAVACASPAVIPVPRHGNPCPRAPDSRHSRAQTRESMPPRAAPASTSEGTPEWPTTSAGATASLVISPTVFPAATAAVRASAVRCAFALGAGGYRADQRPRADHLTPRKVAAASYRVTRKGVILHPDGSEAFLLVELRPPQRFRLSKQVARACAAALDPPMPHA